jgi:hypothetical protein
MSVRDRSAAPSPGEAEIDPEGAALLEGLTFPAFEVIERLFADMPEGA